MSEQEQAKPRTAKEHMQALIDAVKDAFFTNGVRNHPEHVVKELEKYRDSLD